MVKIIASSVRKGNVLEVEGKLYVVLTAQNFHPGKGTPVTQVDMRRIVDGVKVSERWKTTEQVERAFVEDAAHSFLYADDEGFHFMNPESYDQLVMDKESVGDAAAYLEEGMSVILSVHEGPRAGSRTAAPRHARSCRDRAGRQGPDGLVVLQAGNPVERRPHARSRPHHPRHAHRYPHGRRLLRRARQGLILFLNAETTKGAQPG